MVKQPDVLLADEPVPNLDQTTRAEIADLIRELWERIKGGRRTGHQRRPRRLTSSAATLDEERAAPPRLLRRQ
ncbi:MAG: hypothetical protein ACREN7_08570 [Candidatus Dormibacteria bacterium]